MHNNKDEGRQRPESHCGGKHFHRVRMDSDQRDHCGGHALKG